MILRDYSKRNVPKRELKRNGLKRGLTSNDVDKSAQQLRPKDEYSRDGYTNPNVATPTNIEGNMYLAMTTALS